MTYAENMELWNELNSRLQVLRAALEVKARTDREKREVFKRLYQHGWITTNLAYCRPAPEQPAAAQATKLAALLRKIDAHKAECNTV